MKGKGVAVAAALAAVFFLAQGALAHRLNPGPPLRCPGARWARSWAGYGPCWRGVSGERAEKVQELRLRFERETLPLREKLAQKRFELRKLWLEQDPDLERIRSLQREIFALRAEIAERAARLRLEVRKALR